MRRPELSTVTWSHTPMTSRMTCSIRISVTPFWSRMRRSRTSSSERRFALRPTAGSSMQDDLRLADQRARDLDQALLAEGEGGGLAIGELGHADEGQGAPRRFLHPGLLAAAPLEIEPGAEEAGAVAAMQTRHHVLEDGHAAKQLGGLERASKPPLRDGAGFEADDGGTVEKNVASLRAVDAADDVEQGGLARAVGADQPANLALLHVEIDTFQHPDATEADVQVAHGQDGGAHRSATLAGTCVRGPRATAGRRPCHPQWLLPSGQVPFDHGDQAPAHEQHEEDEQTAEYDLLAGP